MPSPKQYSGRWCEMLWQRGERAQTTIEDLMAYIDDLLQKVEDLQAVNRDLKSALALSQSTQKRKS